MLSGVHLIFSQNKIIDSLQVVLKTAREDTNTVNSMNKICLKIQDIGDYHRAIKYANDALSLSKKINYKKGEAHSYTNLGIIYDYQSNYPEALKNYFIALKLFEEIPDKRGIANSLDNMGDVYRIMGNYTDALKNEFESLRIRGELNNKKDLSTSYNNIACSYYDQKQFGLALTNFLASLKIREAIKDSLGIEECYNNLGVSYKTQGNYNEALKYYFYSLEISKKIGDKNGVAITYENLGEINIYLKKYSQTKKYLDSCLLLSKSIGAKDLIVSSYDNLTHLDSITGNWKDAYNHHRLYTVYKDSLFNEKNAKQIARTEMRYEMEKEQIKEEAEKKHREELALTEEERKENLQMTGIGIFILVLISSLLLLSKIKIKQGTLKLLGTFSVLILFEFISLLLHPHIENLTNHNLVLTLLCLVGIASIIVPAHHKIEHWMNKKLVKKVSMITTEGVKVEVNLADEVNEEIETEKILLEDIKGGIKGSADEIEK